MKPLHWTLELYKRLSSLTDWHGRHVSVSADASGRCVEPRRCVLSALQYLHRQTGDGLLDWPYSGPRLAVIIDVKCSNAPWGHGSRQSWTRLMSVPTVPCERRQSLSLRFTMHYNMTLCNSAVCPSRSVHVLPVVLLIISVHSCQRLCRLWNFNCASLCNVFS